MADQPRPQVLRVQPDVLCHPRGDRQPHRVRRQHQRPVLRERPPHRAQQRMDPIRLQHQQVRITANDQHIPGQVPESPRRQPGPHRINVINREYRHFRTIAAPAAQPANIARSRCPRRVPLAPGAPPAAQRDAMRAEDRPSSPVPPVPSASDPFTQRGRPVVARAAGTLRDATDGSARRPGEGRRLHSVTALAAARSLVVDRGVDRRPRKSLCHLCSQGRSREASVQVKHVLRTSVLLLIRWFRVRPPGAPPAVLCLHRSIRDWFVDRPDPQLRGSRLRPSGHIEQLQSGS